jgi:hypothetical protein
MAYTAVIKVGTVRADRMKTMPTTAIISNSENPPWLPRIGMVQVFFIKGTRSSSASRHSL